MLGEGSAVQCSSGSQILAVQYYCQCGQDNRKKCLSFWQIIVPPPGHHYHQSVLTIIKPFLLSERVLCPRHREHLRGKQTLLHLNLPPQTQPSEFWQDCEIITITILYINISTPHIKAWHRNNKIQKILIKMVLPPSMYYTTLTFNFKDI